MSDNATWVRPLGSATADGWDVAIDDPVPGWEHTSLYAVSLADREGRELPASEWEHVVVPHSASVRVLSNLGAPAVGFSTAEAPEGEAPTVGEGAGDEVKLAGRAAVFAGATDVAYVTRDTGLTVTATGGPARVAVCGAKASTRHTPAVRHVSVEEVPVELRGAGQMSREVRNFGIPGVLDADRIIACEVITPGGNWSSYPP